MVYNFNGQLVNSLSVLDKNRAFYYGDGVFDTLKYKNNKFYYLEEHYLRLLASMRQLRMEIPQNFTLEYWYKELSNTLKANNIEDVRLRTTVWRHSDGLYHPKVSSINFLIECSPLFDDIKSPYTLGVYKDYYLNTNSIDNLKTTNRLSNVLASIYMQENSFDNVLMLNINKTVAGACNANLFCVSKNRIYSPPLSDGCLNGIIRAQLLTKFAKKTSYEFTEKSISIADVLSADEVFLTNSIVHIQPITHFKRQTYSTKLSEELMSLLTGD